MFVVLAESGCVQRDEVLLLRWEFGLRPNVQRNIVEVLEYQS